MVALRDSEGKKKMPGVQLMGSAVCVCVCVCSEQVTALPTVHSANLLLLLILLCHRHRGGVWSVLLEGLEGVGGSCLLSLFLGVTVQEPKTKGGKRSG